MTLSSSITNSQTEIFFNPDITLISYANGGLQDLTVTQFLTNNPKSNSNELYEVEYINDQFRELKDNKSNMMFRFQNDCMIYPGMTMTELEAALEGNKIYLFENPKRIYLNVHYFSNGRKSTSDGEYFILYMKNNKIDYISWSKQVDRPDC